MANTVIGFFDTRAEAEDAVNQLTAAGISRSSIDISAGYSTNNGKIDTPESTNLHGDQKEGNAITRFFNSLFGDDSDDAKKYSDVSQYTDTIVTVHAASTQQAEDAADILDSSGAVNVDERYASSGNYAASSGYSSGMDSNSSMNTAAGYAGTTGYSSDGITANARTTDNLNEESSGLAGTRDLDYTGEMDAGSRNTLTGNSGNYTNAADSDRTNSFTDTGLDNEIRSTGDTDKIDRIEEDLQVSKRTVQTGGIRVRSRIIERPVEENIRLREDHVRVERKAVDRPVAGNDWENFREKEIELTEHAEIPVVNKKARVVEEIRVKKDVDNREETVRYTVSSTEVDIENKHSEDVDRDDLIHHEEDHRKSERNRGRL